MRDFKIAVCQNKPVFDKKKSIDRVLQMINLASENGAKLVLLPEMFYYPYILSELPAQEETNKETVSILQQAAKSNKIFLCTGSTIEKVGNGRFNKSFLISPEGSIILEYSKCHLYDVNFNDLTIRESDYFSHGNSIAVVDTELGKIGIIICYDIRFPEMARALVNRGVEIALVPAAFNTISGNAHWHLFFRTRAVENQIFMAAACPARDNECKYKSFGHSLVVDPWGDILSEATENEEIIYAELKQERLTEVRSKLPLLAHMRKDLYSKILK